MAGVSAIDAGARTVAFSHDGVVVVKDVFIPMSDGVSLAADLYLPDDLPRNGALPVVVEYNPYRKDDCRQPADTRWCPRLTQSGYIFARVECRGTGGSGGVAGDEFTMREQQDGYETVEWLAEQPWCDGHVAMIGISYSGFTALQVAALAPPHLTAIIPIDFTDYRYTDTEHYCGGMLRMFFDAGFYAPLMVAFNALPPDLESAGEDWTGLWNSHLEHNTPYILEWLRHQTDGPYWDCGSVGDGATIGCPTFLIGGWHDGYPNPPLRLYANLRAPKKLLIGPWDHETPDRGIPGPRIDYLADVVRWLDQWCKGVDTGILDEPPVLIYVQRYNAPDPMRTTAAGEWRFEPTWPSVNGRELRLGLADGAHLTAGDVESSGADEFEYVPWLGVHGEMFSGGMPVGRSGDQRAEEAYSATYTSLPLDENITIIGRPRVRLRVSSSATVVGLVCRLTEVAQNGESRLVTKGMLNLTRRNSLSEPEPVVPGTPMDVDIELDAVAWSFTPGNRARLSVSSADFPNVWPTPERATNTLYTGPGVPSFLVLPVVPSAPELTRSPPAPIAIDLRYESRLTTPRATDRHRPSWEVVDDCLAGKVRVTASWLRRAWGDLVEWTTEVDKHDPAVASVHGRMVMRRFTSTQEVVSRSDVAIRSTRGSLHATVVVHVELNGLPHFSRSWVETFPRELL